MFEQPWPTNRLKVLGRHIRDGTDIPSDVPPYNEVMLWYAAVTAEVQQRTESLDWGPLLGDRSYEVTSRTKTIDTLRQKLQRATDTPLPSVQDIAGVRFEAEMSLDEQDAVVNAIVGVFDQEESSVKDLRASHHSGYRAVHVWLRLPVRVEVQVRTHVQGAWANVYEAAADVFGRNIRYGEWPNDPVDRQVVEVLQTLSLGQIARMEEIRNAAAQELLRLQEQRDAESPIFDQQTQDRLEAEWDRRRKAELKFRDDLMKIHDGFRAMQKGNGDVGLRD